MKYADVNALLCELGQDVIIKDPVTGEERADTVIRTADLCGDKVPSPWISVKDALPETYVKVLIHLDFGQYTEIWCGRYRGFNGFRPIWEIVGGLEVGENVTHWMPLPDPLAHKEVEE